MDTKDQLSAEALKEGVKELVIREGRAEKIREKKIISLSGVINSARLFWQNRHTTHQHHASDKAHVLYSKNGKYITVVINENSHWAKTVKGNLSSNAELDAFKINTSTMFSVKSLSDLLKPRKFYFKDRSEATKIISNLQKFSADVQTKIDASDDRRGNTVDSIITICKSSLDLDFTLKMPIYKGQKDKEFKVTIEISVSGTSFQLYLVSEDLYVLELDELDAIFAAELKPFQDDKVICIEQ